MSDTLNHADQSPVGALDGYPALAARRLVYLPAYGPDSPVAESQGRGPSNATSAEGLADLASSIASSGLLQPILVEDRGDRKVVIAGERRLRAFQMAARAQPDLPHLRDGIPALVCPGPLNEVERRAWQLAENVCRSDLAPGELGAALLFERCAVLRVRLEDAGIYVDPDDATWPDPVQRWERLEATRMAAEAHRIGAPWPEVLRRLGIHLSEASARKVVRALQSLPEGLAEDMDAAGVSLNARVEWIKLAKGRKEAAEELWAAVRSMGRPDLLGAASKAALVNPTVSAEEAIDRAEAVHDVADANRARLIAARWERQRGEDTSRSLDASGDDDPSGAEDDRPNNHVRESDEQEPPSITAADSAPSLEPDDGPLNPSEDNRVLTDASDAIDTMHSLLAELRQGVTVNAYQATSLRLLSTEILAYLPE